MKTFKSVILIAAAFGAIVGMDVQSREAPDPSSIKGNALTPKRLPDGSPNWTGFWVEPGGMLESYYGPSFIDQDLRGINVPKARHDIPKMKSPYKERYQDIVKQRSKSEKLSARDLCLPPGMPRMVTDGTVYGIEILQAHNVIAMTIEWDGFSRRIWMDLEEHPPLDELDPTYAGHSIGRWEGDTLVIDTVGIREDVPLDFSGIPHSDQLRVAERITQVSPGVLVNEITITDPEVFVEPWEYKRVWVHKPEFRLNEYVCLETDVIVDQVAE